MLLGVGAQIGLAQPQADMPRELQRDFRGDQRVGFEQAHEIGTKEHRQRAVRRRTRLSATRRVVEQGEVAEKRPGFKRGNAAIAAYNSNCTNGNTSSGSFCQQFGSAITQAGGSSSSAAVGSQIMTCYSNPAAAGCQGF